MSTLYMFGLRFYLHRFEQQVLSASKLNHFDQLIQSRGKQLFNSFGLINIYSLHRKCQVSEGSILCDLDVI